jgi:4-hydroxybenzoate polyprenyltransferase
MSPSTALRLGRISNLPTVWSNTLAGVALGGGEIWTPATLLLAAGLSLLYVAGMYLNDAFDRDIDSVERPSRPIPAGLVAANTVFAAGMGLMLAGLVFVHLAGAFSPQHAAGSGMLVALALAAAIVFYDWHHKGNPLSPFFMGLCRVLAYTTAALTVTGMLTAGLLIAAAVVLGYLIGLTYIAKQESLDRVGSLWPLLFLAAPLAYGVGAFLAGQNTALVALLLTALIMWIGVALFFLKRRGKGDVPRAVVSLIAGIAIVDALFLASLGAPLGAVVALICFLLTLCLQRWISGT